MVSLMEKTESFAGPDVVTVFFFARKRPERARSCIKTVVYKLHRGLKKKAKEQTSPHKLQPGPQGK
jgi:hypothetical protein